MPLKTKINLLISHFPEHPMKTVKRYSSAYGKPNAIDTNQPHLGCFLSPEAVEAGKSIGVINHAWDAGFPADQTKYHCKLTEKTGKLMIAEIKHGTDVNVLRNMAAALFNVLQPA